jgi:hypothetical protein
MTPLNVIADAYQRFGTTAYIIMGELHGNEFHTRKTETADSSETSVTVYQTKQ